MWWNIRASLIINDCAYISGKDYYKIKAGSVKCDDDKNNIDLPLDKLIKFNAVTISNRLLIEKDNKLFLESYLEECLYKDYWYEHSINGQSKRIEN